MDGIRPAGDETVCAADLDTTGSCVSCAQGWLSTADAKGRLWVSLEVSRVKNDQKKGCQSHRADERDSFPTAQ